jgi:uncharacterized Zn-binding protein involved in type VI secretion
VFVNSIAAHCAGHAWAAHTCPPIPETHASVLAAGWPTVTAEGRTLGYIGAPVACDSSVASGSPNVFVGS